MASGNMPLSAGRRTVRLTQIDGGKLPNLALMKLAHYHKMRGDQVVFRRSVHRDLFEPEYDRVYGSTIFTDSKPLVDRFRREFPEAIIGGTGLASDSDDAWKRTIESVLGCESYDHLDYSIYPDETRSIGYASRGCRFACGWCSVWRTEGRLVRPRGVLSELWRGDPYPRDVVLLDNDFFGMPKPQWQAILDEARSGDFRVSFCQGINVRVITAEIARDLASVRYYNSRFTKRRLYTAWDNLKDERAFFRGVDHLLHAGVPASALMVYMLVGFDSGETWDLIFHRFNRMAELGMRPYIMVYRPLGAHSPAENALDRRALKQFQRWVNTGVYRFAPFSEYDVNTKGSMEERRRYRDRAIALFGDDAVAA